MTVTVHLGKARADGKRPGDEFVRQGDVYRVIGVVRLGYELRIVTESVHGRELWF